MGDSVLKKVLTQSGIYWAAMMLSKTIGFFLIPLYTSYLDPKDYGVLELLTVTVDIMSLIIGLQLVHAVAKFYTDAPSLEEKKQVISTSMLLISLFSLLFFSGMLMLAGEISMLIFDDYDHELLLQMTFVSAILGIVNQVPLLFLRIQDKAIFFVVVTLSSFFLSVSLTIVFIVYMDMGVFGIILANLIAVVIVSVVLIFYTLRQVGLSFNVGTCIAMVSYSAPLIPGVIGLFVLNFSDRFFLNEYGSMEEVGIYAIGYKFGFLLSALVISPFMLVWGVKMFEIYNEKNRNEILNKVLIWFAAVLLCLAALISIFIEEILTIMTNPKYYDAAIIVPIIAIAYVFTGLMKIVSTPLYAEKRTGLIGMANLSAAIVCLALNFLLIPSYGGLGAAFSTLLSFAYIFVLLAYFSQKHSDVVWEWSRLSRIFLIIVFVTAAGFVISLDELWSVLLVKMSVFMFGLFLLYVFDAVPRDDCRFILSRMRQFLIVKARG